MRIIVSYACQMGKEIVGGEILIMRLCVQDVTMCILERPGELRFCSGREYLEGMEKVCSDSVLVEHISDMHDSDMSEQPCHKFKMNVTNYYDIALMTG